MSKKKVCFIAQFPPPVHGLSKAVETLYNAKKDDSLIYEKIDITNNKAFLRNILQLIISDADLYYFTISQTIGGNLRDLVLLKILELKNKKCLIHLHGGYYRKLVENDMGNWQRKANYSAISKLSGVIVLSKSLKTIFLGMINENRIYVVENCVDDQYFMCDESLQDKLISQRTASIKKVLWLSNFIRSKGYDVVLQLAKMEKERVAKGEIQRFDFHFAGKFFDDLEKEYFEKFVEQNSLSEYITYHGVVGGKEKSNLLTLCDIFMLPTRYPNEGQPISILEAMGNGMFIVTTDHAGIPDIVSNENGIVLKNNDSIDELYVQLCNCDNEKFCSVGEHNFMEAKEKYTQARFTKKIEEIFLNILRVKE